MTDRESSPGAPGRLPPVALPEAAEALLEDWPAPALDWDALADRTTARLAETELDSTDPALLAAPFPAEAGDRGRSSQPKEGGPTLVAIARASMKGDDKARDLDVVKESLVHVAEARRRGETAQSVARTAEVADLERARETRDSEPAERRGGAGWRGGVVGASLAFAAAAALFGLYIRSEVRTSEVNLPADPATSPAAVASAASRAPAEEPGEEETAQVEDLPSESEAARPEPGPARIAKGQAAKPKQATDSQPDPQRDEPPLDEFDQKLPMADDSRAATRLEPSHGEAYSALAAHMGRAKMCVGGHTKESVASVVFKADGHVQSVSVSGPAAGTPAEQCVRNALSQSRVQPFAKPTFSVRLPVRP